MRLTRWVMAGLCIASRATAQDAGGFSLNAGAGMAPGQGLVMSAVQLGTMVELRDPRLRIKLSLEYEWNTNNSPPRSFTLGCLDSCPRFSFSDKLFGATVALQRALGESVDGAYVTAGIGLYSSILQTDPNPYPTTSAMAFGVDGGFGVNERIGSVGIFAQATVRYLAADRGSPGSSVMLPVMVGVRF